LSLEVQAAAIKVAGDWALHIATRKKELGSKEPLGTMLSEEFECVYLAGLQILEKNS
jgi:hypothetical protein